jgi:BON domain
VKKVIFLLLLAAAMAGPGQAASVVKPKAVAARLPDAQVEQIIRAKFARSKINAEHFTVSVKDGIATLNGKTNVIQHKGVATRLARNGGALAVQNRIQISDEARAKAAAKLARIRDGDAPVTRATVVPAVKPK